MKTRGAGGFTLLELLVVIGLIGALSFLLAGALSGTGPATALQSGQATVLNLVTAARLKATASGRKSRLLLNVDPAAPERYLACLALQLARQPGPSPAEWDTLTTVLLPPGVYVVPASLAQPAGLVENRAGWKRASDSTADLVSDLFDGQSLPLQLDGDGVVQLWTGIAFTPNGTLASLGTGPPPKGYCVLVAGARRPPGNDGAPVQLGNPQAARGLCVSAYGIAARLDEWRAF